DAGPVIDGTYTQVAAAEPAPELDDQAAAEPAPELDDQAAAEPAPELDDQAAAEPAGEDLVDPVDPSAFAPAAEPAAPESAPPPAESYMGEPAALVEACARGPLFVLGAIAELTRGSAVDLTRPVSRTLFAGTPVERTVNADLVTRMAELTGVALARKVQAASRVGAGPAGHPSVGWELVPLGLAFVGAVAVPSAGRLSGLASAVGGWLRRGATGAAQASSRIFSRRGAP
ncbi:hypothetical protein LY474_40455, partial [Myxococcus stipitatus]|nr:hypothetical protein [Myxococcus stipitatus]